MTLDEILKQGTLEEKLENLSAYTTAFYKKERPKGFSQADIIEQNRLSQIKTSLMSEVTAHQKVHDGIVAASHQDESTKLGKKEQKWSQRYGAIRGDIAQAKNMDVLGGALADIFIGAPVDVFNMIQKITFTRRQRKIDQRHGKMHTASPEVIQQHLGYEEGLKRPDLTAVHPDVNQTILAM